MKKIFNYLRSMRFGILLLILIAVFSIVGSVIPQGKELSWYVENYPTIHPALLFLQVQRIFQAHLGQAQFDLRRCFLPAPSTHLGGHICPCSFHVSPKRKSLRDIPPPWLALPAPDPASR